MVLIESDWNLKKASDSAFAISVTVLIESDWNLKVRRSNHHQSCTDRY